MAKYKIGYIDESKEDVRAFQRYASHMFEVAPIKPVPEIDVLVKNILDNHVEALVVDFDLNEHDNTIHYNGINVVELILNKLESFPVFVLTSYATDAEENGYDVNIVYEKNLMYNKDSKFLQRIQTQIEKYKHRVENAENRILELLEKNKKSELTFSEEMELADLNLFIEKTLNKEAAKGFKPTNEKRIFEILHKVDNIIKKIDENE
jgi:hypothetical protein